jgi:diaminopimelate decarboxylase
LRCSPLHSTHVRPPPPGTPFYAYDRLQPCLLHARVAHLRSALPPQVKLHYAMKANPMPAVVGYMAGLVDGIDVASAGELKVALDAGADPAEVSFAGPGKRDAELRAGRGCRRAGERGVDARVAGAGRRHRRRWACRRGWRCA